METTSRKKPGPAKGDPRMDVFGKIGGTSTRTKYGHEHFAALGKLGGQATKENQPAGYYARIGKVGGAARSRTDKPVNPETKVHVTR